MQKLLEKTPLTPFDSDYNMLKPLDIASIEKFYLNSSSQYKIGLEFERLSLDKNTHCAVSFDVIENIILQFVKITGWSIIFDDNKTVIGAKDLYGSSISLEPGCQMELSLAPEENILEIDFKANKIINLLDKIADAFDVIFVSYGINPKQLCEEIDVLNKERYKFMNEYLPHCDNAKLCTKMMRKTAGIQINIDYKDKKDAYLKLKFFNLIMPFMAGLSANSIIENDVLTDYKTNRANIWLHTGNNRCNVFYKNIFKNSLFKCRDIFKNYIKEVLDVPMIYIVREGKNIPIMGQITFRTFLKNGYKGYFAKLEDYILHQSMCFPDVRLKNYIEIRNHDSNNISFALALCAFYKGICLCDFKKLLKEFNYLKVGDIEKYNYLVAKEGLNFMINPKTSAWEVVISLFNNAKNALTSTDRIYLKPIFDLIEKRKTPSDLVIDYDIKNTEELLDYLYG